MRKAGLSLLTLSLCLVLFAVIGRVSEPVSASEPAGSGPITGTVDRGFDAREHPLPQPSTMPLLEYEKMLFPWIRSRDYAGELGWVKDKGVRDTGPYIKGKYYGTHPAVRIYYSPKVMYWATGNPDYWPEGKAAGLAKPQPPRHGEIPDGGMIVKEMFAPPAARYRDMTEQEIVGTLYTPTSPGWTVMVKDSTGAPDGWFWASVWVGQHYDTPDSMNYPEAGFGLACVRCHAVAKEKGTFTALRNVEGFPGDPLAFFVDETWRDIPAELQPFTMTHSPQLPHLQTQRDPGPCLPNPEFLFTFDMQKKVCYEEVQLFPSESNDHVPAKPVDVDHYLTSDQCMMCHSGGNSLYAFGPIMFLETERGGLNVSPYGEWRWSPMGLAGRDPVFHAQLESEIDQLKRELGPETGQVYADQVVNTCLRCHGAMGKRQFDHDRGVGDEYWSPEANFKLEWFFDKDPNAPHAKYGKLARDGISCTVCHHMVEEYENIGDFLANSITGQFKVGPADELYGPFEDVVTKPMEHSVGMTPKHSEFISKSRMCASCHVINLPVVDWPLDNPPGDTDEIMPPEEVQQLLASEKNPNLQGFLHRIEQATYLEWLNSKYQTEFGEPGQHAQECQDCHMRTGYESLDGTVSIDPIQTKIATIEDQDYPEADYRLPIEEITVKFREEGFRRHTFQGLNIFLAEMFSQFNDVLGVRMGDFETGTNGLPFAIENFVINARRNTADIEITRWEVDGQTLEADVRVVNKTGHRLPSGVGFRRLWIEFLVLDDSRGQERVVWGSGRTNGVGVLVDDEGQVLPTEFFDEIEIDGKMVEQFQPHHTVITEQDQVQIYEELASNAKGKLTTSFIHRAHHVKENRLLPQGWTKDGPSKEIPAAFIHATHPGYEAAKDPAYGDGSGSDTVTYRVTIPDCFDCKKVKIRATLYSQAWAPYYLRDRFKDIPDGPDGEARRRLYYLTSHLKTDGTPIEDWKFEVVTTERDLEKEEKTKADEHAEECADGDGKGCG